MIEKQAIPKVVLTPAHTHEDLRVLADNLKAVLASGDTDDIYARAQRFHQAVAKHIQQEEGPEGLFAELEKTVSRLVPQLDRLREQHQEILADFKIMCAEVDNEMGEALIPLIDDCLKLIQQHEAEEEEMIAGADYSDGANFDGSPG